MSVSLVPVAPSSHDAQAPHALLVDVWSWVRAGVVQILEESKTEMLADDVYMVLRQANAFLFLIRDESGEDLGFTIVQRHVEIDGSATLLVWFMWCPPGALWRVQGEIHEHLAVIARNARCKRLRMHSTRSVKAWQRRGWEPKQTVFERGV